MNRSAWLSEDGLYRYRLDRRWGDQQGHALWVMLNPSTADAYVDDPTIRRCIGFTRGWGYDALAVVNLYALRCTRPEHLEHHPDPVGPSNTDAWQGAATWASVIVLAWGAHRCPRTAPLDQRDAWWLFYRQLPRRTPQLVLGMTQGGDPRHPLFMRAASEPRSFEMVP